MANQNMTFREAYGVLQRHAETLRTQTEPNIDQLLPLVEESVAAYRVCKERIDAVEMALEQALMGVTTQGSFAEGVMPAATGAGTPNANSAQTTPGSNGCLENMDYEAPF